MAYDFCGIWSMAMALALAWSAQYGRIHDASSAQSIATIAAVPCTGTAYLISHTPLLKVMSSQ